LSTSPSIKAAASRLANKGFFDAIAKDPGLKEGVNTYAGHCTYEAVASAQRIPYSPLENLIANRY
jgi:alanine dehydrogenase